MKITRDIREYLLEEKFEIKVYIDSVNVINYKELGHFDNNKVTLYHENGVIIIKGEKLVVSKLMNKEVLITGLIKNVELG